GPRSGLGVSATLEVLRDWTQSADSHDRVLIIDPGWANRAEQWRRGLTEIGLRLSRDTTSLKTTPSIHWLGETASIGHGPEAWSMSRIRGLGTQQSLRFNSEWLHNTPHPDHSDWSPEADINRLESLARSWHILGGYGALSRWLRAFASPSYPAPWEDPDEAGRRAECTQWWFLSLVSRLSPLLSSGERALLDEIELSIGCYTGAQLPLPDTAKDGDQWISQLFAHLDWESMQTEAGSLQRLLEEYTNYRSSQSTLGHPLVSIGSKWAEQFLGLIEDMETPPKIEAGDQITILTPNEALGATADIIILTHMTNAGWALRTEKLPWLDELTCKEMNLCRPDTPLRDARHALHHLMHASPTVILIDASGLDEDCQPAAPIAEWFSLHGGADTAESVPHPSFMTTWSTAASERTRGYHLTWIPSTIEIIRNDGPARAEIHLSGRSIRDNRQRVGLALRNYRQPISPPLRPESISLPLDSSLMQDRLRRQPTKVQSGEEYLGMELHNRYCGVGDMKIVPTAAGAPGEVAPRNAASWPVLGGKLGRLHLLANDPRPLSPSATSLPVFDQRNGLTGGAKKTRTRWSASRLQRWQACPRQGWLERRLSAGRLEQQNEDLDARIRGDLVHGSRGVLFENVFTLHEHTERSSVGSSSLANMGFPVDDLFAHILDYVGRRAPWLEREDATASQRRHDLIGLSRKSWLDWLASPQPMPPSGRLGNLLLAELELHNSIPISIEWSLNGIEVEHPDGRNMQLTGFIDRVDVFHSPDGEEGADTVAPLDWSEDSEWKPKRLILIRDIKSVDGPKATRAGERHRKALFDELQLGLYARSWELAHPGDLVIGVGISEVGSYTNHSLEVSPAFV
ncbi:MAG: PD-(D/E)XK nuclease family protein, partial [Candidatus Thermoplasmatota archaeon]|nr:PD-(D/E)XK nuclease family protein [Candidatus Thermoplasmatota archaeon]